jgi:hypothetical protein
MPVPKRQLKPARARLQADEQIVFAVAGTNAKTGAMVRGGLLGLGAAAAVSAASAVVFKHFTVYSFWLPFAGAGWAAKRSPIDSGNPPFALGITNIFVVTTSQLQVWAHDIGTNQGQRNRLTRFLGAVPLSEILSVTDADGLVTLSLRSGHSIRTKLGRKDASRLVAELSGQPSQLRQPGFIPTPQAQFGVPMIAAPPTMPPARVLQPTGGRPLPPPAPTR